MSHEEAELLLEQERQHLEHLDALMRSMMQEGFTERYVEPSELTESYKVRSDGYGDHTGTSHDYVTAFHEDAMRAAAEVSQIPPEMHADVYRYYHATQTEQWVDGYVNGVADSASRSDDNEPGR